MSFSKNLGKNTPQCYTKPLDSLKNWNNRFFWVDGSVFSTVVDWRSNAPKDGMPAVGTYSVKAVRALDTHRTPIQKQLKMLLCLVGLSRRYYLGDEVYGSIQLNSRSKSYKATASESSGMPPTIERSPLDFSLEAGALDQGTAASEVPSSGEVPTAANPEPSQVGVAAADPLVVTESRKRGRDGTDANAPPSVVAAEDPESENASSPTEFESPGGVYRPEWGVTNGSLLDTPKACQDLVDHVAPSGYFFELRHMRNEDFLGQYNVNLARQVALGSQLRLRFEQEAKLLRKSVASLKEQVSGEEKLKAAFEEFKQYEDEQVKRRCAELDMRLDVLSIDFDEEVYPHMLTAIVGRRWVVGHGLRLAMIKCAESLEIRKAFADVVSAGVAKGMTEGLKHEVEHRQAQLTIESIKAYDPEAEAKFVATLQSLKNLKYPMLDQLEGLNDALMDVIMAALYLESDTEGGDAP
nr:hypothetical protein [Tanacetum cinerariifolium]